METATLSTNNVFGENAALLAVKTLGEVRNIPGKLLQFGDYLVNTTDVNGSTANVPTNSTIASQLIVCQGTPKSIEGTSEARISSINWFDFYSLGETTETSLYTNHRPSVIFFGDFTDPATAFITKLVGKLTSLAWTTPAEEFSLNDYYDIGPEKTHESLSRGYATRLARAMARYGDKINIDVPVIVDGGDW